MKITRRAFIAGTAAAAAGLSLPVTTPRYLFVVDPANGPDVAAAVTGEYVDGVFKLVDLNPCFGGQPGVYQRFPLVGAKARS